MGIALGRIPGSVLISGISWPHPPHLLDRKGHLVFFKDGLQRIRSFPYTMSYYIVQFNLVRKSPYAYNFRFGGIACKPNTRCLF